MESWETNGHPAPLPEGVPPGVRLLDHLWLGEQEADGARLTLLDPSELTGMSGAADALRAELSGTQGQLDEARAGQAALEQRVATEKSANRALLAALVDLERRRLEAEKQAKYHESQVLPLWAEVSQLRGALYEAQRALWRKLLRRRA